MVPEDDKVRKISHVLHEHPLLYRDAADDTDRKQCEGCCEDLDGPYVSCERCQFRLHILCALQPPEIRHPFHPQHKLEIFSYHETTSVCEECLYPWRPFKGFSYFCIECDVFFHLSCALSTKKQRGYRSKKILLKHPGDPRHDLILYQEGKLARYGQIDCLWCTKPVSSGRSYACIRCQIYLHEDCTFRVPLEIRHPSHRHTLRFREHTSRGERAGNPTAGFYCRACKGPIRFLEFCYLCVECQWRFHCSCSSLIPSLKYEHHDRNEHCDHKLTYLENTYYRGEFSCHSCGGSDLLSNGSLDGFYRCMKCDKNFHLTCILPTTAKHKYH